MQEQLDVGAGTLAGVRVDLPVEMEGTTFGEGDDDDGEVRGQQEGPDAPDCEGGPAQGMEQVGIEEQEHGDGEPEEGRVEQAGDESEEAAYLDLVPECGAEGVQMPHEGIVGGAIHEQKVVIDEAGDDDDDTEDGEAVVGVEFEAVDEDDEEAGEDDAERKAGADPGCQTSIAAGDHGETAFTAGCQRAAFRGSEFAEVEDSPTGNGVNMACCRGRGQEREDGLESRRSQRGQREGGPALHGWFG